MFRRIELINSYQLKDGSTFWIKHGLTGVSTELVADAWCGLHVPRKKINKNNGKFYFTELGWNTYGREVVKACIQSGQEYRVISVEEHDVSIIYRDEMQVVLHPKRRGR
jgi:hypothetical protein